MAKLHVMNPNNVHCTTRSDVNTGPFLRNN